MSDQPSLMPSFDRRQLLTLAGVGLASAIVPLDLARGRSTETKILFDPAIEGARALATTMTASGRAPLALTGDRLHFWKRHLGDQPGPVTGITHWSDFVLLRGLAAEQGLRLRGETRLAASRGRATFVWEMA